MHQSRLFRRRFLVYIKNSVNPLTYPFEVSPKDVSPKRRPLAVIRDPFHMCLLENVFLSKKVGAQPAWTALFSEGPRCFNVSYVLWAASNGPLVCVWLFVRHRPVRICGLGILSEPGWGRGRHAHLPGFRAGRRQPVSCAVRTRSLVLWK